MQTDRWTQCYPSLPLSVPSPLSVREKRTQFRNIRILALCDVFNQVPFKNELEYTP